MNRTHVKRLLCVLCCLLLVVTVAAGPATIKVQAAEVVIGGLILAGALIALMAASGITVTSVNMDQTSIQNHVLQLWEDWQTETAEPVDSGIYEQLDIAYDGRNSYLRVGDDFLDAYDSFADWVVEEYELTPVGEGTTAAPATVYSSTQYGIEFQDFGVVMFSTYLGKVDGLPTVAHDGADWCLLPNGRYYLNSGNYLEVVSSGGATYFIFYESSGVEVCRSSYDQTVTWMYCAYVPDDLYLSYQWCELISNAYDARYDRVGWDTATKNGKASKDLFSSWLGSDTESVSSTIALVPEGAIDVPQPYAEDDYIYVGSDVINPGMTLEEATAAILAAVEAGTLSASQTQELSQSDANDIQETIEFNDGYAVDGLEDVFPFCIPFDIIDFLETMNAEREAPHIEWPIQIPSMNFEYTIVIDLEDFENVAVILRTMELLLFIVGLAYVTRSMMIRG